jgi:S-adenosylmethionine decarboxylase
MKTHKPLGRHLLIDLYGGKYLDDVQHVTIALLDAAAASGAKVIDYVCHDFGEGMGVSVNVILSESHINIHTWPEDGYAMIDIATCGDHVDPNKVLPVLAAEFETLTLISREFKRGGDLNSLT